MDAPEPTVKLRCISPLLDPPYAQLRLLRHAQVSRRRQPIGVKAGAKRSGPLESTSKFQSSSPVNSEFAF
ncbi:hypothetical protein F2Q69_00053956 [Brassica cretica]|uniref:Uncharacterized protein n=1 Tax=Brassica cretica TaxID=69181 RepID=A0A8S9N6F8_BRACR|nr:hypothetical protein F2Q69_00053956 [Brassica cretica]